MKKALFLLLISYLSYGQQFKKLDSLQFSKAVDQLVSDTGKPFKVLEKGSENGKQFIKFQNTEDENDRFVLMYYNSYEGANENLEKPGVKVWNITSVAGRYLSLFPIWKNNIQPASDKEALANKKYLTTEKGTLINSGDNFWIIRMN